MEHREKTIEEETKFSPEVEEQLKILMRGTFFADEAEGGMERRTNSEVVFESAENRGGLREQMRRELGLRLSSGKPLRVYLGVDPTARSLHIGHLVPVLKLRQFQDLGHQVVFLIGDYTGLIGDPSGRTQARIQLDAETLKEMSSNYTDQVFRILDPTKTEVRRNSEWLADLRFEDIIRLAAQFPLKQIVARRDFQERMERGESLRFHETLYALMQGYDAYALHCDIQVGGYDQYFNLLAGRVIQEAHGEKPHVMITLPLLPGTDGRKMSKSYANTVDVTDSPADMFGKVMRISDDLIARYLESCCMLPAEELDGLLKQLGDSSVNPMELKLRVAEEITALYHGAQGGTEGKAAFERLSMRRETPPDDEIPVKKVEKSMCDGRTPWYAVLADLGLVESRGAAKRLIKGGGFKVNGRAVKDWEATLPAAGDDPPSFVIQYGKRNYARLETEG